MRLDDSFLAATRDEILELVRLGKLPTASADRWAAEKYDAFVGEPKLDEEIARPKAGDRRLPSAKTLPANFVHPSWSVEHVLSWIAIRNAVALARLESPHCDRPAFYGTLCASGYLNEGAANDLLAALADGTLRSRRGTGLAPYDGSRNYLTAEANQGVWYAQTDVLTLAGRRGNKGKCGSHETTRQPQRPDARHHRAGGLSSLAEPNRARSERYDEAVSLGTNGNLADLDARQFAGKRHSGHSRSDRSLTLTRSERDRVARERRPECRRSSKPPHRRGGRLARAGIASAQGRGRPGAERRQM